MDILLYDTETEKNDIYDIISNHLEINFIKVKTKDDFFTFLEIHNEDSLIIIDVSFPEGEEIFNSITNSNRKRKILVLSKTLTYNLDFTCAQCAELFRRKLLLKPLNVGQFITYLQNFDTLMCKYSSDSNNIVDIMEDILTQFLHYHYDQDRKRIVKRDASINNVSEFVRITELLNKHNIKYEIELEEIKLHF